MFIRALVIALALYSQSCFADFNKDEPTVPNNWLKGLPEFCSDFDFKQQVMLLSGQEAQSLLLPIDSEAMITSPGTHKQYNQNQPFRVRVRDYVYELASKILNIDLKQFNQIKLNDYIQLEIETNFDSGQKFESIHLNARLSDELLLIP